MMINNNTELRKFARNENLSGNGTKKDPFVLNNSIIDGSGKSHSLYLRNTDLHFKIEKCIFRNSSSIGVETNHVSNFSFERNTVKNVTIGLFVESSSDNEFIGNRILDVERTGVAIAGASYNNSFYRNRLQDCGFFFKDRDIRANGHEIAENNTVNGEPVLYYRDAEGLSLTGPAGQIMLVDSKQIDLHNLILKNSSIGIQTIDSTDVLIKNLTIRNQKITGISCRASSNISIRGSTLSNNSQGISVLSSNSIEIRDNDIVNNDIGIELYKASNNTISSNKIASNDGRGIELKAPTDRSSIQPSEVKNYSTSNNTVKRNTITKSGGYGIYVSGISYNNRIYLNIIENNRNKSGASSKSFLSQAYEDQAGDIPPNHWYSKNDLGNYWGNWSAQDQDRDGIIGDPYLIDNSNSTDRYPLSSTIGPPQDIVIEPRNRSSKLKWNDPEYSISTEVETVRIYRGKEEGNLSLLKKLKAPVDTFSDHNLTNGETYYYRLQTVGEEYKSVLSISLRVVPDGNPPEVTEYNPTGEDVPVNTSIVVKFSEKMEKGSVNITIGEETGDLRKDGKRFVLELEHNLSYGKEYLVKVTGKDKAKNELEGDKGYFTWTFKTISNGTLVGKVVDENGTPIEGVKITSGKDVTNFTDENGRFKIEIAPGEVKLKFSKQGYLTTEKSFVVESAKSTEIGKIKLEEIKGERSRLFYPMALVGAVTLILGIIAIVVFLKNWGREDIPSQEEIYEEDFEDVSREEFESWWEDEDDL